MEITNPQTETIAGRLEYLALLYRQGQASEIMTRTLSKLFDYEIETCRNQLQQLQKDLSDFERQYSMSSEEFYQRFHKGLTHDNMDFTEWASLIQMSGSLEERLALLTGKKS